MSYTNQYSTTTGATGGSTVPFDNSGTAKGGNDFGATAGGTDMHGTQSDTRGNDDGQMDESGNTMAGYGEGFGAGTGTSLTGTGRDATAISDGTYGNYTTGSDAGRTGAPPVGFRGGANDPAYQPGQHYDFKHGGLVRDDGADIGKTNVATGHSMPGHHDTEPINTSNTTATNTGMGSGTGAGTGTTDWGGRGETDLGRTRGTVDTGFGPGTTDTPSTAPGFDTNRTPDFDTDASEFGTGRSDLGTTTGNTNTTTTTGTHRGFNAGQQVNTGGGGEGWTSGMTGLTEEEIKQVQEGRR